MKIAQRILMIAFTISVFASCKKDKVDNCRTCDGDNLTKSFEVCEEGGRIFADGQEIPESDGISLDRIIRELEADEDFVNLSCK